MGWITLAFAAAILLPRYSGLVSGVALWEDWHCPPSAHLESYRLVAAAELALMQAVFGPDYLIGPAPWFMATLYLSLGMAILVTMLRSWGLGYGVPMVLGTLVCLHPMVNEFLNWHVLSSFWIAVPLTAAGLWMVLEQRRAWLRVGGLVLIALGGATMQLATMLAVVILFGEVLYRGVAGYLRLDNGELAWRAAAAVVAPFAGLAALVVLRFGFGYVDFADRTVSLGDGGMSAWLASKFYVVSNALANVYQAPVGALAGRDVAVSIFGWGILVAVATCLTVAVVERGSILDRLLRGFAVPLAFLIMLMPLFATSAIPTGFRVIAFATIGAWFVASIVVSRLTEGRRALATAGNVVALLVAGLLLHTSLFDQRVRNDAFARDLGWRMELAKALRAQGVQNLLVCHDPRRKALASNDAPGIVVSYNRLTVDRYSNIIAFPFGFLAADRLGVESVAVVPVASAACAEAPRAGQADLGLSFGRLVFPADSRESAVLLVGR